MKEHYTVEPHAHGWAVVSTVNGKKTVHVKKNQKGLAEEFAEECNQMMDTWRKS